MSDKINDGGPAFPLDKAQDASGDWYYPATHAGMSIRDYFAAAALQGLLANPYNSERYVMTYEIAANEALGYADAMLRERAKHGAD